MLPSGNRNYKLAAKGFRAAQRRKLFELLNGIDDSGLMRRERRAPGAWDLSRFNADTAFALDLSVGARLSQAA